MTFERIIALKVTDEGGYQLYRKGMMPILESYGGAFGYDFRISEVLQSKSENSVNRMFTIEFPDRDAMTRFFADPDYLDIRKRYFENAVESVTVISLHEKQQ